jgi:hypothetical protein
MNRMLPNASFRSCPSCGAALNSGAMSCNSCGGLVVVENIIGRLKSEIRYQSSQMSARLRKRSVLLWTLAVCPLVILPPVLAIMLSFRKQSVAGEHRDADGDAPDALILVAAICNIILSVLLWRWISDAVWSTAFSFGSFLKSNGSTHPNGMGSI